MITKAIVEEVINGRSVRVRIPILDRMPESGYSTPRDELPIATICTPPNLFYNPIVGDIVYVGFEDNDRGHPVVLGYLLRTFDTTDIENAPSVRLNSAEVTDNVNLPYNTFVGSVKPDEIKALLNISENIQDALDALKNDVKGITERITALEQKG